MGVLKNVKLRYEGEDYTVSFRFSGTSVPEWQPVSVRIRSAGAISDSDERTIWEHPAEPSKHTAAIIEEARSFAEDAQGRFD